MYDIIFGAKALPQTQLKEKSSLKAPLVYQGIFYAGCNMTCMKAVKPKLYLPLDYM